MSPSSGTGRRPLLRFRRRSDALLLVVDAAAAAAAGYVAFALRFEGTEVPRPLVVTYLGATAFLLVLWILLARSRGLYSRAALRPGTSNLEPAFVAAAVTGAVLALVNLLVLGGDVSRAWIGLVVLGLLLAGIGSRALIRRSRRLLVPLGVALERYAIVGEGDEVQRLHRDLTRAPGAPFRIVAVLSGDDVPQDLLAAVRELRLDGLVLPPGSAPAAAGYASRLSGSGVDVLVAPQVGDLELRVSSIAMLHGLPLLRVAGLAPRRAAERVPIRDRGRRGVAILGTRGVPANYGGFETFAEQLGIRLVQRGVATTVYGRSHYVDVPSPWRGIRLVVLPTIRSKYLDTVVHTALSSLHLLFARGPRDVVLCNAANAPVLLLLRLFRRRVVLNVDGLEWRRSKWGIAGRSWYRLGEWLSVRLASVLVTDAEEVRTYYRVRHDTDSVMIPYGADLLTRGAPGVPAEAPVPPDGFVLYVSRWERENNPLLVARAHATSGSRLALVMLGSETYDHELGEQVRRAAGPAAHLPGALFGESYRGLQANARCYVHATEVGGTHPALIEALGAGNLVLVLDTPENREVVGDAGRYFSDEADLVALVLWAEALGDDELARWRGRARTHAASRYSWEAVSDSYLALIAGDRPRAAPDGGPT